MDNYSLSDLRAAVGDDNGAFGGNGAWWVILLFLFSLLSFKFSLTFLFFLLFLSLDCSLFFCIRYCRIHINAHLHII